MHIPIIIFILYGLIEIEKESNIGMVSGIILGIGGIIPCIVHKIIVRKENHFNLLMSNAIIYLNTLSGIGLFFFSSDFIT